MPSNASNMRSSSMSERQTIDAALRNPRLLGAAISDVATWRTWRVVLKAAFGLGLSTPEERAMTAWSAKVSISSIQIYDAYLVADSAAVARITLLQNVTLSDFSVTTLAPFYTGSAGFTSFRFVEPRD